ncbi:hypothetical protein BH20ACT19_BH20ACT19_11790 [soil metagenome]
MRVRVYERGVPGNAQSGGESRVFRHAHDDPRLARLVHESRGIWDEWQEKLGVELVSDDGAITLGSSAERRLEVLEQVGNIPARMIASGELAERLPLLAAYDGPAMLDEGGGAIRTTAAIGAVSRALGDSLVADEVISLRSTDGPGVEVRSGGTRHEYERVVVCAGRETAALARHLGLALPVRLAAHVRITFAVRGEPPQRLACLQDGSGDFGETGVYAAPTPGNRSYAVGLSETVDVQPDGGMLDPDSLAALAARARAYVQEGLPGLDPEPVEHRHCWVTDLPWSEDGVAVWQAGGAFFVAGHNLFKQAPALGRALAAAACGDGLDERLRPQERLGKPR